MSVLLILSHRMPACYANYARVCFFVYDTNTMGLISLAWAEMYLLVAALVQYFTFQYPEATAADFEVGDDRFTIGTKAGCDLMARVTSC